MPAVRSVVTIHPTREDHTTEHTEVAPFLCALCALCGNNIPSTGGSYHGAHRGFSNFSVPAVLSVVSFGLIRLYHQLSLLGYNTDLCQLVPLVLDQK